jgi:hypothetical protein
MLIDINRSIYVSIIAKTKATAVSFSPVYKIVLATNKTNSVALVRERRIPTERPLLVGRVSTNFCGQAVSRGQRIPIAVFSDFYTGAAIVSSK